MDLNNYQQVISPVKQTRRLHVTQIAKRLELPTRTVRYWCEIQHIPAYKLGPREWCVDEDIFLAWLADRKMSQN